MVVNLEQIEKELTELLSKNLGKLKFPTGLKVIQETIEKYFKNYDSN